MIDVLFFVGASLTFDAGYSMRVESVQECQSVGRVKLDELISEYGKASFACVPPAKPIPLATTNSGDIVQHTYNFVHTFKATVNCAGRYVIIDDNLFLVKGNSPANYEMPAYDVYNSYCR